MTRSLLKADYSADGVRPRLAPLNPAIINAAAEDEARLSATQIRISPRNDTPAASNSQGTTPQGGPTPASGGGTVATPRPGTPVGGGLPTATLAPGQPTPTPASNVTTAPGTSTPNPSGTRPPTATPQPGSTPTITPGRGATDTPAPMPPADIATPLPPTSVPPTATPIPPTDTPVPPTASPVPPTATPTPSRTATPTSGNVPLLPLPCIAPGSLVSLVKTEIVFSNQSSGTIRIYWLNALGIPQFRGTVAPGQERSYDTYATHTWVVRDAADNCIAAYTLAVLPGIAVIE